MNSIRIQLAVAAFALAVLAGAAGAEPDYAREQHFADEVVPSVVVGSAVTLKTGAGRRFLGLFTPAEKPRAALILVHGTGVHPDFGLVGALRALLADRSYVTLSIQMPVLAANANKADYAALFPEAGQRLEAALAYLEAKGIKRVGLVSHGMGARMANDYISRHPDARLVAWLPLSISTGRFEALARVRFPVFDIYAEKDFVAVRKGARGRAKVLRGLPGSKQAMVYGTDHYFARKEKEVAALIDRLLAPLVK